MHEINPDEFLALPQVAFVASGHNYEPITYVFVSMPSLDTLRAESRWTKEADYWVEGVTYPYSRVDFGTSITLQQQWPGAIFVDFHCTCCGGGGDLVADNTCCDCGALWHRHLDDCLWGTAYDAEWSRRYELWQRGYRQGQSGRRCTQRTLDGRRGYRAGRKDYKVSRHPHHTR